MSIKVIGLASVNKNMSLKKLEKGKQMNNNIMQQTQKRSLLGTRIVLDEEKILRENKYDLNKIHDLIDEIAKDSGLIKIDKHTYRCKGNDKDLAYSKHVYI